MSASMGAPPLDLPRTSSTSPPTTWTSFSEHYFETGFEDPFLEPGEDSTDSVQSVEGTEVGVEDSTPNNGTSPSSERYWMKDWCASTTLLPLAQLAHCLWSVTSAKIKGGSLLRLCVIIIKYTMKEITDFFFFFAYIALLEAVLLKIAV